MYIYTLHNECRILKWCFAYLLIWLRLQASLLVLLLPRGAHHPFIRSDNSTLLRWMLDSCSRGKWSLTTWRISQKYVWTCRFSWHIPTTVCGWVPSFFARATALLKILITRLHEKKSSQREKHGLQLVSKNGAKLLTASLVYVLVIAENYHIATLERKKMKFFLGP